MVKNSLLSIQIMCDNQIINDIVRNSLDLQTYNKLMEKPLSFAASNEAVYALLSTNIYP